MRVRLVPVQVDIALADGDLEGASTGAAELEDISQRFRTTALSATARFASGAVALARNDAATAATVLQHALRLWRDIGAPYETARTRLLLSSAFAALGDQEGAAMELRAAHSALEALGAPAPCGAACVALTHLDSAMSLSCARPERVSRGDKNFTASRIATEEYWNPLFLIY